MVAFDAVVLAGGQARRLGGVDKAMVPVAGQSMLIRVLEATFAAERVIVVGPARSIQGVTWVQEEPAGGGPVAALAAGLDASAAAVVFVVSCDLPRLGQPVVRRLIDAVRGDGCILVRDGRDQPLCGAYRRDALRAAITALPQAHGAALRGVTAQLELVRIEDSWGASLDVDTPEDLLQVDRLC